MNYSKYPDLEMRQPREFFTGTLRRVCSRLDGAGAQQLEYQHSYLNTRETSTVEVCSLWVVGSYARGASTCGDLDLVLAIKASEGTSPKRGTVTKAFIGIHAGVRVYIGDPTENTSGISFGEAVLIWQPGMDWDATLRSIPLQADAGRYERLADRVPLRSEQHGLDLDLVNELVKQHELGVLAWRFIPLSELPHKFTPQADQQLARFLWYSQQGSNKSKLAPIVFAQAQQITMERHIGGSWYFPSSRAQAGQILIGGVRIHAESFWLTPWTLDQLDCTTVAFIPTLSTRGPNGFWIVERGANHRLVKTFEDVCVWTLVTSSGYPSLITLETYKDGVCVAEAQACDIFDSEDAAREYARESFEEMGDEATEADRLMPRRLCGREVLELLACVDVVTTNAGEDLPLNGRGFDYCRVHDESTRTLTPTEIADKFRLIAVT